MLGNDIATIYILRRGFRVCNTVDGPTLTPPPSLLKWLIKL